MWQQNKAQSERRKNAWWIEWNNKFWRWCTLRERLVEHVRLGEVSPKSMSLVSGHLSDSVYSGLGEAFWTRESCFSPSRYVQCAFTPLWRPVVPWEDLLAASEVTVMAARCLRFGLLVTSKSMHSPLLGSQSSSSWPLNRSKSAVLSDSWRSNGEESPVEGPEVNMQMWPNNNEHSRVERFLDVVW